MIQSNLLLTTKASLDRGTFSSLQKLGHNTIDYRDEEIDRKLPMY